MANSPAHSFFYRIVSASNVSPSRMADFACPHPPPIASLPTATPQLSVANAPGVDAHTTIPSDSEVEFLGGVVRRPSEHIRAIVDEQGGSQVLQLMHQEHLGSPESDQVEMPVPAAVPVPVPVLPNTDHEAQNFEMVRRQWQAMHNNILNDLEREYHYNRYAHHQQLQQYQQPSRPASNSFSDISEESAEESATDTDNQNMHYHQGSLSHAETRYGRSNHHLSLENYRNREVAPSFNHINFEGAGQAPRSNTIQEAEFRLYQYSSATVHNFHADSRVCVYDHSNQSHHHNVPLRDLFEGARYNPQSLTFLSWPPRQPTTINRITSHFEDTSSASSSSSSSYTSHSIDGSIYTGRDNGSYSSSWPQPATQSANLGAHNRSANLSLGNSSTAALYTNRINHNNNQNNIFHLYTNHDGSQWIKVLCRADCPQNVDCIRIIDNSNPNYDPSSHSPAFNRHHHHGLCIRNHRNATIWQQLGSSITESEYQFHQYHLQVDCDPGWSLGSHSNSSNLNSSSSGSIYSHYQSALHSQPHQSQPGASHSTIFTGSAPFSTSFGSSSSSRIGSHQLSETCRKKRMRMMQRKCPQSDW